MARLLSFCRLGSDAGHCPLATMKSILDKGTLLVGSPATVREQIEKAHARTGFKKLIPMIQFGTLPDQNVRKSVQMFAEEVIPKLRGL